MGQKWITCLHFFLYSHFFVAAIDNYTFVKYYCFMSLSTEKKIAILSDAAKYDVSCSTSGSSRAAAGTGMGNTVASGICHSWSADGRCVSLLKVLFSNACIYDCAYCANRMSGNTPRAGFDAEELVRLTMAFYRRNYIEGLFLSSAVAVNPDRTMETLVRVAKLLRLREEFNGYIHVKAIPGASAELVLEACRYADRISVNIELPSAASLALLAPDKGKDDIVGKMRSIAGAKEAHDKGRRYLPERRSLPAGFLPGKQFPAIAGETWPACAGAAKGGSSRFLPAGQTTQMVIGASPEPDITILRLAEGLYRSVAMKRVYYSAYIPVGDPGRIKPGGRVPLLREHRLYQADWLFRFYGFKSDELLSEGEPNLARVVDPKAAWALKHMEWFPVDVMKAERELLLRVPGLGCVSAARIIKARKHCRLGESELKRLGVVMKRARYFLSSGGHSFAGIDTDPALLRTRLADRGMEMLQPEFDWDGNSGVSLAGIGLPRPAKQAGQS